MRRELTQVRIVKAETQMTAEEVSVALDLFAEIIARTYANEHRLLRPDAHDDCNTDDDGALPPASRRLSERMEDEV